MRYKTLATVALRYRAIFLDIDRYSVNLQSEASPRVIAFVSELRRIGFCVSEELLHALNEVPVDRLADLTAIFHGIMGVDLNWAPLVKGWNEPTGETIADHFFTFVANALKEEKIFDGVTLPCGHIIPDGTFPIERYNGCPFCGTPFVTADYVFKGQGSKLKELRLFTTDDLENIFLSLLSSPVPLDATQNESLQFLLKEFTLTAKIEIPMKETMMLVIKSLVNNERENEAASLFRTPTDILRYLWYEKTGHVQIIEPKTLIAHSAGLYRHMFGPLDRSRKASEEMKAKLRLKYDRKACLRVAKWLNDIPMSAFDCCENMNPKRGMWVRIIRALRLGEYSRKNGFGHLAEILDIFYKGNYTTWQGRLNNARITNDEDMALQLLSQRPGLFARCLFSTMLRFDARKVAAAFSMIAEKVPARLLLSLCNAAEIYFDKKSTRTIRTIIGTPHTIGPHKFLWIYSDDELTEMIEMVKGIYSSSMLKRFASKACDNTTIYIDPMLYKIPVAVGNRTSTVQDTSCALMGTRFPVDGDEVRLFLQWGKGLHAQHLDMDLSCRVLLPGNKYEECAYYHLTCVGAKHSGDIRSIPEMVGTAEYINLSLPELEEAGAGYVLFTCNAYSAGALSPNLVVGWMDSAYPMELSEKDGVAYDPSCVQHMVRISENDLSKGLAFGVLDVKNREIIWLEMPFMGQTLRDARTDLIQILIRKLESKVSVGEVLSLKAKAQNLTIVGDPDAADEKYTYEWALNPADVTKIITASE